MKSLLTQLRPSARTPLALGNAGSDIVSRLPFELHIIILAYLEPNDVDAGLHACRGWRDIWLSEEVWPKLAQRWYPGLEDYIRRPVFHGQDLGEMFRRALHKIQRRVSGRFASALHYEMHLESEQFFTLSKGVPVSEGGVHSYDEVDGLECGSDTRYPRFMMYNDGRIAWWPEAYVLPYFAVVDDLRTRKRRAYLFPNHKGEKQGYKTAMSNKLILMGRGKMLHAWHLELDQLRSTEVPDEFVRCIAEGETVIIVSKTAEVFLWRFGEKPQHINTNRCYGKGPLGTSHPYDFVSGQFASSHNAGSRLVQSGTLLDFIISPDEENVFFIIAYFPAPMKLLRVCEMRNGKLAGIYRLDRNKLDGLIMDHVEFTNIRWEKIDSYGGYCLTQALSQTPNRSDPESPRTSASCRPLSSNLVSVCFNIYTKQFTILHYHYKECHNPQTACQVWNGRIVTSDIKGSQGLVLSLRPCKETTCPYEESRPIPLYTMVPNGRGTLLRRQHAPYETHGLSSLELHGTDFALDSNQQFDSGAGPPVLPGVRRVVGDDDFLLLVVRDSCSAWSFNNDISEKPNDSKRSLWRSLIR
ncbi:uncharacterized protein F4822DRAFT_344423 [Hypoxylon trugodes]|uniref:uncharacterized protein n=1 Tax=Hypoxylon trugodes TaxID=326681 RepID=UPI002198D805|nr:uncharacterized protein F4822DRAFT_344423 [Hypoxylon trugodes]KAI1385443.1 hypothetical protein F4822DRAFT_344423 [Hypoxylon trugodes]